MLVDSIAWANLNPKIAFKKTRKKYFGKYIFKAEMYLPGAYLLRYGICKDQSSLKTYIVTKSLQMRRHVKLQAENNKMWMKSDFIARLSPHQRLWYDDLVDPDALYSANHILRIKGFRCSTFADKLAIYSNDEALLLEMINALLPENSVNSITAPGSSAELHVLEKGNILTDKVDEFKYKIHLRSGRVNSVDTANLYNFVLRMLDSKEMIAPNFVLRGLGQGTLWYGNYYLMAKDLGMVTLLNLTVPGIVSTTHELSDINELVV